MAQDPKKTVTVRMPRQLVEEVHQLAKREDETPSVVLRRLLRRGLRDEPRTPPTVEVA